MGEAPSLPSPDANALPSAEGRGAFKERRQRLLSSDDCTTLPTKVEGGADDDDD